MIRVRLPTHLRTLAGAPGEVMLDLPRPASIADVLNRLESVYPVLKGTMRDQVSGQRRPFIRFYACERDCSLDALTSELPEEVQNGREPLLIIGAMAGG